MGEIVVILIVALLVLGPQKLPDAAKQIGKAIRELRKHTQNLQETIEQDEAIGGTVRELKSALRGDVLYQPPPAIKPPDEKPVAQNAPLAEAAAPPLTEPPTPVAHLESPNPSPSPSPNPAPTPAPNPNPNPTPSSGNGSSEPSRHG